jgi:D-3-phosphoglycerate dehydrogenase
MKKALLLENIDKTAVDILKNNGFEVDSRTGTLDKKELIEILTEYVFLGIRSKTKLDEDIAQKVRILETVGTFTVGFNHIDLNAFAKAGIPVFYAPYESTRSVVELALGEILMLARRAFEKSTQMHAAVWDKSNNGCFEVRGKKLGIIGYGNIGSQLSIVAEALGMHVCFYDIADRPAIGNAIKLDNLDEILKSCDVITLHVDGRASNINLIGESEFKLMKQGVVFLNLSRGNVVDIDALVSNLESGKVAGCGIDVFPDEPKEKIDRFESKLQNFENVILTPHIGGNTLEAQASIGKYVVGKINEYINTGNTSLALNIPNITLPVLEGASRITHYHKNVPGVLSALNDIFREYNINILGQYLKTNEENGYVITDISEDINDEIMRKISQVENTIRVRKLN